MNNLNPSIAGDKSWPLGNRAGANVQKFSSFSEFPAASDYGVGIAQAEDTGAVYAGNGFIWSGVVLGALSLQSSNAPAENTALIQSALNNRGVVRLTTPFVGQVAQDILVNDTLVIPSNTTLVADPGLNLKLAPGVSKTMIVNYAYTQAYTTISGGAGGITVSGRTATISHTAHGLAVGDPVEIAGVTQRYYNGVFKVASTPSANSFTVELRRKPTVTTSTGTPKFRRADENIAVVNLSLDYDYANQTYATNPSMMCTVFAGVYGFYCDRANIRNCHKYGVALGAIAHGRVNDSIFYNTQSGADGVHSQGPSFDLIIDGVAGYTGDDAATLTIGDTPNWEFSRGDHIDVTVRNLAPDHCNASAFKYAGNAPYTADNVTIENIDGTYQYYGAVIYDDTNGNILVGSNIEKMVVRGVKGISTTNSNQVYVAVGGEVKDLEVLDVYHNNPAGAAIGIGNSTYSTPTYKRLKLEAHNDLSQPGSGSSYLISVGAITVVTMIVDVRGKLKNGFGLYIPAAATGLVIDALIYSGDLIGEGTSLQDAHIYHGAGSIKNASLRMVSKDMREMFMQDSGIADNTIFINLVDVVGDGGVRVVDMYTTGTVNVGNVSLTNHAAAYPLRCAKGKQVHFRGNRVITNNNMDDITTSGSGTNYVLPHGPFKIDGAVVSGGGGLGVAEDNHFFNSNSSWASGTGTDKRGKYAWNGSAWVKVYGPA